MRAQAPFSPPYATLNHYYNFAKSMEDLFMGYLMHVFLMLVGLSFKLLFSILEKFMNKFWRA